MCGQFSDQGRMFSYLSPEERVPKGHPLRAIRFGRCARWFGRFPVTCTAILPGSMRALAVPRSRPSSC